MSEKPIGRPLRLDADATSSDAQLPAFLSRTAEDPVYHGFPLISETDTGGWIYGAITEFEGVGPQDWGDGFVIAPDGRRAGLVWSIEGEEFYEIIGPEPGRWGVYGVRFPKVVRNMADLVDCFRHVLPKLQQVHAALFP